MEGDFLSISPPASASKISIHALRVEGDALYDTRVPPKRPISIHALRVEGDTINLDALVPKLISIHALRVEGDQPTPEQLQARADFYPRPPGGGRLASSFMGGGVG